MKKRKLGVVILAAGYSSRMEGFKPLLKFDHQTLVKKLISTYKKSAVEDIVLVLGHRGDAVMGEIADDAITCVFNASFSEGMFSSIKKGIEHLDDGVDAFFIHPVDIPLVKVFTINALVDAFEKTEKSIVYPCFLGRCGHPPLIHKRCKNAILTSDGEGGLKNVLSDYAPDAFHLPLADQSILMDMDTQEDYEKLLAYHALQAPNDEECTAILEVLGVSSEIRKSGMLVQRVALDFEKKLREKGLKLDRAVLSAAALLHDIMKKERNHAGVAGEFFKKMGYDRVGELVATHMDIQVEANQVINENEVLYLADKLVDNDEVIALNIRKEKVRKRFQDRPEVLEKIEQRFLHAEMIEAKIRKMGI